MNQNEQKIAPLGQDTPKSPADRVRLIQEMQRAAEASPLHQPQPVRQAQQSAQAQATQQQPARVPDGFAVKQVNAVQQALQATPTSAEAAAIARAQASTQALFGGSTDLEITGNPWKVIPFGDTLPALFADTEGATAKLPEKAVKLPEGSLFQLGLTKGAETQKRAVLVGQDGKLAGAECKTPQDAQRLLSGAAWLLPASAKQKDTTWKVSAGTDSAFTLELTRGAGKAKASERLSLDNFGRLTTQGRKSDILVANYYLDRFDAAV